MTLALADILRLHSKQLQMELQLDFATARIEVQCLLQDVLKVNRAYLLTYPERVLDTDESARYTALFERRRDGVPIAYLLGEREFFGLNFIVTADTLIPRADTEVLVEQALQKMQSRRECHVLDLGTGSGAVALAIAHARADAHVVAVDVSVAALDVARINVQRLNLNNVRLVVSDWFTALAEERVDFIVSNPPYIEENNTHLGMGDVRFEPRNALTSGKEGLDDIRCICNDAKAHLYPDGWLMLEHGYNQAAQVRQLLLEAGFVAVTSVYDLSGIERVSLGSA
ncbi:MAG: peptide chain release factor N(5)-glutamine methyltransferase [Gallionella sp.]